MQERHSQLMPGVPTDPSRPPATLESYPDAYHTYPFPSLQSPRTGCGRKFCHWEIWAKSEGKESREERAEDFPEVDSES